MDQKKKEERPLKIVNIGLARFYEAVIAQGAEAVQLDWHPPLEQPQEVRELLDMFL